MDLSPLLCVLADGNQGWAILFLPMQNALEGMSRAMRVRDFVRTIENKGAYETGQMIHHACPCICNTSFVHRQPALPLPVGILAVRHHLDKLHVSHQVMKTLSHHGRPSRRRRLPVLPPVLWTGLSEKRKIPHSAHLVVAHACSFPGHSSVCPDSPFPHCASSPIATSRRALPPTAPPHPIVGCAVPIPCEWTALDKCS
jgi:hypothetical protein